MYCLLSVGVLLPEWFASRAVCSSLRPVGVAVCVRKCEGWLLQNQEVKLCQA